MIRTTSILAAGLVVAVFLAMTGGADARAGDRERWGAMLQRLDTDRDGRISRDEFMAGAKTMFERMDRDGNGFVDSADRAAWQERSDRGPTDADRRAWRERYEAMSPDERRAVRERMRERYEALDPEQREALRERWRERRGAAN